MNFVPSLELSLHVLWCAIANGIHKQIIFHYYSNFDTIHEIRVYQHSLCSLLLSLSLSLSLSFPLFHSSIYWERCYSLSQYPTRIMPRPPRILDPANPTNNLYISGVGSYSPYQHCGEYVVGDGNWTVL